VFPVDAPLARRLVAVPTPVAVARPDLGYPWPWGVSRWLPGSSGDFHTGNLLAADGRLSAVIDFGGLGAGDPATDLQIAYTLLEPAPRAAFRAALDLDEATWARGRGWTLTGGLPAHRAYAAGDARIAEQTTRQITAALADAAPSPGPATGRPAGRL
jgi:hypothetical protein